MCLPKVCVCKCFYYFSVYFLIYLQFNYFKPLQFVAHLTFLLLLLLMSMDSKQFTHIYQINLEIVKFMFDLYKHTILLYFDMWLKLLLLA